MSDAIGTPPARLLMDTLRRCGAAGVPEDRVGWILGQYPQYDGARTLRAMVRHGMVEPAWRYEAGGDGPTKLYHLVKRSSATIS